MKAGIMMRRFIGTMLIVVSTFIPLHGAKALTGEDILFNVSGIVGLVDTQRDKWNKNIRSLAKLSPIIIQGEDSSGVQMAAKNDMGYEITNPIFTTPSQPDFVKYTVVYSPPHNTPERRSMLEALAPKIVQDYASRYRMSSEIVDLPDDHGLAMVILTCKMDAPKCPF